MRRVDGWKYHRCSGRRYLKVTSSIPRIPRNADIAPSRQHSLITSWDVVDELDYIAIALLNFSGSLTYYFLTVTYKKTAPSPPTI
jgi:hypothetical protein